MADGETRPAGPNPPAAKAPPPGPPDEDALRRLQVFLDDLRSRQRPWAGLLAGSGAALAVALLWVALVVRIGDFSSLPLLLIGLAAGLATRRTGRCLDSYCGIATASVVLIVGVVARLLVTAAVAARSVGSSLTQLLARLDGPLFAEFFEASVNGLSIFLLVGAVMIAYRLSLVHLRREEIERLLHPPGQG